MALPEKKYLLVEGKEDLYAIVQLMASHIPWGDRKADWPVKIHACGSVSEILAQGFISAQFKSREVETLGIIIDADDVCDSRWSRLRSLCQSACPDIPVNLPSEGYVWQNDEGKRLGIWIMPDNTSRGMIETFMRFLVPQPEEPIWLLAKSTVTQALTAGAKCREAHIDKANIYTWMAWQDPPGQDIGTALVQKILDPHAPNTMPFVNWFRRLYEL